MTAASTQLESRGRLLTAEQLADRWQVSKAQVYRLAREGRVPTVWVGRYCRFRLHAVEEWEKRGPCRDEIGSGPLS